VCKSSKQRVLIAPVLPGASLTSIDEPSRSPSSTGLPKNYAYIFERF